MSNLPVAASQEAGHVSGLRLTVRQIQAREFSRGRRSPSQAPAHPVYSCADHSLPSSVTDGWIGFSGSAINNAR